MQKPVNCFTLQIDWNGFYMMVALAFNELKHVRWMQEYKDRDKVIKASAFSISVTICSVGKCKTIISLTFTQVVLKVWDFGFQIECLSIIRRNAKEKNAHKAKRVKNYQHFNKMDILTDDEGILMKS